MEQNKSAATTATKKREINVLTKANLKERFNRDIIRSVANKMTKEGFLYQSPFDNWNRMSSEEIIARIPNKLLPNFYDMCFEEFKNQQEKEIKKGKK